MGEDQRSCAGLDHIARNAKTSRSQGESKPIGNLTLHLLALGLLDQCPTVRSARGIFVCPQ
jgi:hypothetical protein